MNGNNCFNIAFLNYRFVSKHTTFGYDLLQCSRAETTECKQKWQNGYQIVKMGRKRGAKLRLIHLPGEVRAQKYPGLYSRVQTYKHKKTGDY